MICPDECGLRESADTTEGKRLEQMSSTHQSQSSSDDLSMSDSQWKCLNYE